MNSRIVIRPGARDDLAAARSWYEEQQAGLGLKFLGAADSTLLFLSRFPRSRPVVFEDIRRANLTGFPYALFYRFLQPDIFVLAVQHQSRITDQRLEELF